MSENIQDFLSRSASCLEHQKLSNMIFSVQLHSKYYLAFISDRRPFAIEHFLNFIQIENKNLIKVLLNLTHLPMLCFAMQNMLVCYVFVNICHQLIPQYQFEIFIFLHKFVFKN